MLVLIRPARHTRAAEIMGERFLDPAALIRLAEQRRAGDLRDRLTTLAETDIPFRLRTVRDRASSHVLVPDPGWSTGRMMDLFPRGRVIELDWYSRSGFNTTYEDPAWRLIRVRGVAGSLNHRFRDQRELLRSYEEPPSVRELVTARCLMEALGLDRSSFADRSLRTSTYLPHLGHVLVADEGGVLYLDQWPDATPEPDIGIGSKVRPDLKIAARPIAPDARAPRGVFFCSCFNKQGSGSESECGSSLWG